MTEGELIEAVCDQVRTVDLKPASPLHGLLMGGIYPEKA